ncbi:MAG: hypothetical protein F4246_08555 [Rhodothermaceae bacterium]|nr:hypothetical protein [Rhodothermaceae bacterium]MYD19862.1 hypothetical protein [Rhodothermaceae bacterium]MYD57051.1 hypothetical protein [Rhodothermaceae bacterium]MYI44772.1 hypothetical protein [Rhodothermaceae bacterium]MYJ54896.1 hypothetical protein [Rhodothermaceae bacterium]
MKRVLILPLVLLVAWGCDTASDSELTLEELVVSETTLWLSEDKGVFAEAYHTLPSGLHWSTNIGRSHAVVASKVHATVQCSMSVDAGRREAAAYARCIEAMVKICDVGLQDLYEEGDATITTTGYDILERHDDGSITLTPCNPEDEDEE